MIIELDAEPTPLTARLVHRGQQAGALVHDEPAPLVAFEHAGRLVSLARVEHLVDVPDDWQLGQGYRLGPAAVSALKALARAGQGQASYRRRPGPLAG